MTVTEQSLARAFTRMNRAKQNAREKRQEYREAREELDAAADYLAKATEEMQYDLKAVTSAKVAR